MKSASLTLSKILTYILVVLFVLTLAGAAVMLLSSVASSLVVSLSGMYVVYGDNEYTDSNASDGFSVEWQGESYEAVFNISNTEDWGIYNVQDCSVKVIANYTDKTNFDFTVDDKSYVYSNVSDLSAAFLEDYSLYDGKGISVDEEGNFSLFFDVYYTSAYIDTAMNTVLSRVYGGDAEVSSVDISSYPYFALQITSPDSGTVLTIPFTVNGEYEIVRTYSVDISSDSSDFIYTFSPSTKGLNVGTMTADETLTVTIIVSSDYMVYSVGLVCATLDSQVFSSTYSDNDTVTIQISNPSFAVTIYVLCIDSSSGALYYSVYRGDVTDGGVANSYECDYTLSATSAVAGDTVYVYVDLSGIDVCVYRVEVRYEDPTDYSIDADVLIQDSVYSFVMPSCDVEITVYITDSDDISSASYSVNISSDSQDYIYTFSPSTKGFNVGTMTGDDTLTVTIISLVDYVIYSLGVDNATLVSSSYSDYLGGNTVTFVISNPTSDVTITSFVLDAVSLGCYSVSISSDYVGFIDYFSPCLYDNYVGSISSDGSLTITVTALSAYVILDVSLDNATLVSSVYDNFSGGNTVTIVISDPTDVVTISFSVIDA